MSGNSFTAVTTPVEVDEAGAGSIVSEGDEGLADAFAAFLEAYGIDISSP